MNKMDPDEEEEDDEGNPIKRQKAPEGASGKSNSSSNKNAQVSLKYYMVLKKELNRIFP